VPSWSGVTPAPDWYKAPANWGKDMDKRRDIGGLRMAAKNGRFHNHQGKQQGGRRRALQATINRQLGQ